MKSSLVLLSALAILMMAGCTANRPVPSMRPIVLQNSLEAVEHWKVLALETAVEIEAIAGGARVSVEGDTKTPFGRAFHGFLTTQLVRRGVDVAPDNDGAVKIAYEVQVVNYPGDRPFRAFPGVISAGALTGAGVAGAVVAGGAAGLAIGAVTGAAAVAAIDAGLSTAGALEDNTEEVIIHTAASREGRYLLRRSDIFYIRPAHVVHYLAPPEMVKPVYPATRNYAVVKK